jgi:hypothetical protein
MSEFNYSFPTVLPGEPAPIVGTVVAGESLIVRKKLESIVNHLIKSNFDIGSLLHTAKSKGYYQEWGFNTFQEYESTLNVKRQKLRYLRRIAEVMEAVGISRETYEPLGTSKLREITSLNVDGVWKNPESGLETPMKEFIVGFVEKGKELELDAIKQHVKTLKGILKGDEISWLNIPVKRTVLEETIRPALELAKKNLGSVGKDEEGISLDASDGRALEIISVEYINDPSNNGL